MNRAEWIERTVMLKSNHVWDKLRELNAEDEADRQMVLELARQLIERHVVPSPPDCKGKVGYPGAIGDLLEREKEVSIIDFGISLPDLNEPSDEQIKKDLALVYGFNEEELASLGEEWRWKFWRCWRAHEALEGVVKALSFLLKPLRGDGAGRRIEVAGEMEQLRALREEYRELLSGWLVWEINDALKLMEEYQSPQAKAESDDAGVCDEPSRSGPEECSMDRYYWIERTVMLTSDDVGDKLRELNAEDEADRQMVLELARQFIAHHVVPSPDCKAIDGLSEREKRVVIIGLAMPDLSEPSVDRELREALVSIHGFEEEELARLGQKWRWKLWRCWRAYEAMLGVREAISFLLEPLRGDGAGRRIEVAGEMEQLRALREEHRELLSEWLVCDINDALKLMEEYQARQAKAGSDERA